MPGVLGLLSHMDDGIGFSGFFGGAWDGCPQRCLYINTTGIEMIS